MLREHELHSESIAVQRAHVDVTNGARFFEFDRDDLVQQTIGHADRRLSFGPCHIPEL